MSNITASGRLFSSAAQAALADDLFSLWRKHFDAFSHSARNRRSFQLRTVNAVLNFVNQSPTVPDGSWNNAVSRCKNSVSCG
jgi:hypothetical protein